MQAVGSWVPPWQWAIGGGVSVSGYGTSRMPQAPLWVTVLFITVSLRPPAMMIPEPIGDGVVSGVCELLFVVHVVALEDRARVGARGTLAAARAGAVLRRGCVVVVL